MTAGVDQQCSGRSADVLRDGDELDLRWIPACCLGSGSDALADAGDVSGDQFSCGWHVEGN
jgi:hypothetical protein